MLDEPGTPAHLRSAVLDGEPRCVVRDGEPATMAVSGVTDGAGLAGWLTEYRAVLRASLLRHGHLVLRGLPMRHVEDLTLARDLLVTVPADQLREETTLRSAYGDGVFSATDAPPVQTIRLHN